MFWKVLKMELVRAMQPFKIVTILVAIVLLMLVSDLDFLGELLRFEYIEYLGIIDNIELVLGLDAYKCVMAVLLASLYTNSFCKDDNSHYLRMILSRVDVTTYTQCRFIANLCVIVLTSMLSFWLYALILSPFIPMFPESGTSDYYYYKELHDNFPIIYIGLMGLVFGLVVSACSSIGILYSVYNSNSFVSIAMSGLALFVALSYIPVTNPLNILNLLAMRPTIGQDVPWPLMILWILFYMFSVIGICAVMFWKRMKWRAENGLV